MRLYTIGHSTRPADELIALLKDSGVDLLADVRSVPLSRHNPQFNADVLAGALAEAGIEYRHLKALGGRRGAQKLGQPSPNAGWRVAGFRNYADYALAPAFRDGLQTLLDLANDHTCAVMCAEAHWSRCHRRIITDHLLAAGHEVDHILGLGETGPARLTPHAQVQPDRSVHYPARQGVLL